MNLKIVTLVLASAFLLAACTPKTGSTSNSGQITSKSIIKEGEQAPGFSLETFTGETVNLADFKGKKAVFVDFWAGWCPFCVGELPEIEKISNEFKDDLVVLGIHRTETEDVATGKKFADDRGVTYALLKDADGSLYKSYTGGQNLMPVSAFIDKEGKVIKLLFGPKTESQMRENVQKII